MEAVVQDNAVNMAKIFFAKGCTLWQKWVLMERCRARRRAKGRRPLMAVLGKDYLRESFLLRRKEARIRDFFLSGESIDWKEQKALKDYLAVQIEMKRENAGVRELSEAQRRYEKEADPVIKEQMRRLIEREQYNFDYLFGPDEQTGGD